MAGADITLNTTSYSTIDVKVVTNAARVTGIDVEYDLLSALELDEEVAYDGTTSDEYGSVTLNRSLKSSWNTLCLPFSLTSEQVTAMFGEGAMVAQFDYSEEGVLYFVTEEQVIRANEPCLIKVATAGNRYTCNDVVTTVACEGAPVTAPNGDISKIVGNYASDVVPAGCYFVSNNLFYLSSGSTTMKGFRAYVEQTKSSSAKALSVSVNGTTTSIDDLETVLDEAPANIYNLNGQLVRAKATSTDGLPQGIYIFRGKKIAVQ